MEEEEEEAPLGKASSPPLGWEKKGKGKGGGGGTDGRCDKSVITIASSSFIKSASDLSASPSSLWMPARDRLPPPLPPFSLPSSAAAALGMWRGTDKAHTRSRSREEEGGNGRGRATLTSPHTHIHIARTYTYITFEVRS